VTFGSEWNLGAARHKDNLEDETRQDNNDGNKAAGAMFERIRGRGRGVLGLLWRRE
jgi:hypothetical protein